ncbi:MAG: GspH/FimT family pseudopilin [Burkholderiaceae bacterium]
MGVGIDRAGRIHRSHGYTLVELLVVMVVLGILLGLVSLSIVPDPRAKLQRDAERLESLFALAAEEAQLTSRPIAWRGDEKGYAFFQRDRDQWVPFVGDAQFRARNWDLSPMRLTLAASDVQRWSTRSGQGFGGADDGSTSLAFPRDGLQVAFELKLEADGKTVLLKSDGVGRYWVEPGA